MDRLKLAQKGKPRHTWLRHHFQGQKVKGQLAGGGGGGILWRPLAQFLEDQIEIARRKQTDRRMLWKTAAVKSKCESTPADDAWTLTYYNKYDADEKIFAAITSDRHHVLHHLLPPQSSGSQNYNLWQRTLNFALTSRSVHLTDNNFIRRKLYFDVY